MEDVRRYDLYLECYPDRGAIADMLERPSGEWVAFTDYAALRAESLKQATQVERMRDERDTLRAEVERLKAERDALARRMRVVEMHVVACRRSDGTYWLDYPSGRIAFVICALNDDARARGYWPTASAALDAAADALEAAGMWEE